MDYIEKLDLQTEELTEVETLEKHTIINNKPFSVNKYEGHDGDFLAVDGDYNDGFNQLNKANGLGINCIVSKRVNELKTSLDNMMSDIEELKQDNINVDLSSYAKKSDLEVKADKSYVDSAIESVDVSSQLTNYATKTELGNKVDKIYGKGLSTNDYTTAEKNKLSGLTNYTHPTSHSATMITEDSTHRFVTDNEKSSWNNKSNLALGTTSTTAFRGDYGNTAYTHSQSTHAPSNAQKNSDITKAEIEAKLVGDVTTHTHSQYLTSHQSLSEYPKTTELTLGFHTDGMIYLFKGGQPIGNGVAQSTQSGDVVGFVDSSNNIVLSGTLPDGTYTFKYEMNNGSIINIGSINFTSATYTNLIPIVGYTNDVRISTSDGTTKSATGYTTTGMIDVNPGDVVRTKGLDMRASANQYCSYGIYNESGVKSATGNLNVISSGLTTVFDSEGNLTFTCGSSVLSGYKLRLCGFGSGANLIVTVNEEIK